MLNSKRYILVVDDDGYIRDSISDILKSEGYLVETCADPIDGYERCARNPAQYGLVFMDIHFPEGKMGYDLGRRISMFFNWGGPRVIGMTGHADLYSYERRLEFGMVDVMMKPLFKYLVLNLAKAHFHVPDAPQITFATAPSHTRQP